MEITVNTSESTIRIELTGDMDERGAAKVKSTFEALHLAGIKTVILDFGKVTYIGSAGLGKLLLFYKKCTAAGTRVRIDNCGAQIKDLLKEVRLDTLFVIQ